MIFNINVADIDFNDGSTSEAVQRDYNRLMILKNLCRDGEQGLDG